jgi:hypothetical protein
VGKIHSKRVEKLWEKYTRNELRSGEKNTLETS